MPSDTYYARLLPIGMHDRGLRSFAHGGQLFIPEAGFIPVSRDSALLLAAVRSIATEPASPFAFQVLAPGAEIPTTPPIPTVPSTPMPNEPARPRRTPADPPPLAPGVSPAALVSGAPLGPPSIVGAPIAAPATPPPPPTPPVPATPVPGGAAAAPGVLTTADAVPAARPAAPADLSPPQPSASPANPVPRPPGT